MILGLTVFVMAVVFGGGAQGPAVELSAEGPAPLRLVSSDDWAGLPDDQGREIVYSLCSTCHSLMLVKQQGLSRDSWDETLVWMVEEQGMPDLDEESRNSVLDYLARHYGIDSRQN